VNFKPYLGDDRAVYEHPDGSIRSISVKWTDMLPPDSYEKIGQGRSRFRVEDLVELVDMVAQLEKKRGSGVN